MSEVTLEAIAGVVEKVVDDKLQPIKEILDDHTETLERHTTILDQLLTKKKTKDDEETVAIFRFSRLENWAKKVGEKLRIKFEL